MKGKKKMIMTIIILNYFQLNIIWSKQFIRKDLPWLVGDIKKFKYSCKISDHEVKNIS